MDFFDHQDRARRNTGRLVLMFALAVVGIIAALYVVVLAAVHWFELGGTFPKNYGKPGHEWTWWRPELLVYTAGGAAMVIFFGSAMKIASLSGGGAVVAAMMGGRQVGAETRNAAEQRLVNVVEEMSIASGVPVPQIFVMDFEDGINAFAAGFSINDAAVCVTRGCLATLSRDELQGVIAHEFSHILNGDMKLNIRLIGVLAGILLIGQMGIGILRGLSSGGRVSTRRSRSSGNGGGGAILAIIAVALALALIGYVGVFFGRLIKAAVSRQREFLADASAIQFTRNPGGIAGALKKIGGFAARSSVAAPAAEEASHMFFGDALGGRMLFSSLLSTHPPLDERIRRIDPSFDGEYQRVVAEPRGQADELGGALDAAPAAALAGGAAGGAAVVARPIRAAAGAVVGDVGTVSARGLAGGARLIESIPDDVRRAAHEPYDATLLIYALLMSANESERREQAAQLQTVADSTTVHDALALQPAVAALDPGLRLPLADLAYPALRQLGVQARNDFARGVTVLVEADRKVSLFEFAIRMLVLRRLERAASGADRRGPQLFSFGAILKPVQLFLSTLAHAGHADPQSAERAFASGLSRIGNSKIQQMALLPREECRLTQLEDAVEKLADVVPGIKRQIIDAAAHCVLADEQVTVREAELLRAAAQLLGCPLPPFLSDA